MSDKEKSASIFAFYSQKARTPPKKLIITAQHLIKRNIRQKTGSPPIKTMPGLSLAHNIFRVLSPLPSRSWIPTLKAAG
ncbi:MAG: hypothetical protein HGA53_02155 [Anaerolineaceae bacterium]|nr:hypothetical protein [Anaerolineaceae bacterium]